MNTEQERNKLLPCPFCGGEAHFDSDDDGWNWIECSGCGVATNQRISAMDDCRPLLAEAWNTRAALQSQPEIDEAHLSIVLDVYDNAMQKAFEGREFQNPCKPGTPEHKAWEKGNKEGKKKRDAGLPNSIALQSQDAEDAADMFWDANDTEDCLYACNEEDAVKQMVEKVWPTDFPLRFTLQRAVRMPDLNIKVISMSDCGTDIQYEREAIDHARRAEDKT